MKNHFYQDLANHNLALTPKQKEQFDTYVSMLVEWNKKMNLTAIDHEEDIYTKHFLDSIIMSYKIPMQGNFCDVGSGAGFPSIPLKIVYPDIKIWIVEPLQKRCTFLQALVTKLGLDDVTIVNARAEDYAKENRESFDIVSARAVANLTMLCELCIPFVKKDGIFVAMKGPNACEELDVAKDAIEWLGGKIERVDSLEVLGNTRNNIIIKKVKNTPKKYPRAFAQIKKNPLRRK